MEAYIGEREAAADHEVGHALIGTFENGWDSLRRAWVVEGQDGWGGGTDFDRLTPDAKALARVALAGPLAEGKRAIERQGHVGNLTEHAIHAQNVRAALNQLANDVALVAAVVEIQVAGQTTQTALSRQDAAYLGPFTQAQLIPLIEQTSRLLNDASIWAAHGNLAHRLLNPPPGQDPDINYTHVWQEVL